MRKVRFWDKHDRRMVYADEARDNHKNVLAIGLHGLPVVIDQDSFRDGNIAAWNVDHRYERMDSTGLPDDKGVEIYEGDVLGNEWGKYLVRWVQGGFLVCSEDGVRIDIGRFGCEAVVVIGNVHENPGLFGYLQNPVETSLHGSMCRSTLIRKIRLRCLSWYRSRMDNFVTQRSISSP